MSLGEDRAVVPLVLTQQDVGSMGNNHCHRSNPKAQFRSAKIIYHSPLILVVNMYKALQSFVFCTQQLVFWGQLLGS